MALFKGILAKEGKGVGKGSSERKSAFALFFEIYFRKFWNIGQVSLIYVVCAIPMLVVMMCLSGLISRHIVNMLIPFLEATIMTEDPIKDAEMVMAYTAIFDICARAVIALAVSALWGMGPVTAGFTYIMRNYAREEHAFPWSDFWEHTKKNFKQSIVVWILDVLVFGLTVFAFMFYSSSEGPLQLVKYIVMFIILAYTFMHIYVYQLMVTYELKLKEILKNAFLLGIAALPSNVVVVAVTLAVNLGMIWLGAKVPFIAGSLGYWTCYVIFALLVAPGFSCFLKNFVANRTIKRLFPKAEEKNDAKDEDFLY